jgi:hypothetical protein
MKKLTASPAESPFVEKQRVVVVYETPAARARAMECCSDLSGQQSPEAEPEIDWYSFALLLEAAPANDAADKAATADLIIFAVTAAGDLPGEVKLWIERWLNKRSDREGAIVGLLTDRPANPSDVASLKEIYLRHTAHRAGMDYLTHATPTACRAIPNSLDSFSQRAGQMTSVLDQILHTHLPVVPPS